MQVRITLRNGEYTFTAEPGERLLYAGLRQGVPLAYECATGTCGTCKATLLSGAIADAWLTAPGAPDRARYPDARLLCQCLADGDCAFSASGLLQGTTRPRVMPDYVQAHIQNLHLLTSDVCLLTLLLPNPIDFEPGQFVLLETDGVPGFRAYSIVEGEATAHPTFIIKRKLGGGMTDWLFESAQQGMPLRLFGPLGAATFRPESDGDLLLLAGASGLSMVLSVLDAARRAGHLERHRADVVFGVRNVKDLFLLDRLAESSATVTIALSETEDAALEEAIAPLRQAYPNLHFVRGFVHEAATAVLQPCGPSTIGFIAGPPPMIDACLRYLIGRARLPPARIRYDKFS